jgi:hypothetical protein
MDHSTHDCFGLQNHFSGKSHQRGPPRGDKGNGKCDHHVEDEDEDFQVTDRTVKESSR